MFLAFCLVAYIIYEAYRIEKQKSYDSDRGVNWSKVFNRWVLILGVIFLIVGVLKCYKVVGYINSDTAQKKRIRTALMGKWRLAKTSGFRYYKIKPNSILKIHAYFRKLPDNFFPEVYSVTVLNPQASSIQAQEVFLQNPNNEEFGLAVSTRILKLNQDTLILTCPPFITSTENTAVYERLR